MDFFPNIMRIHIMDNDTRKSVPNIAIRISIFARFKNNYHFTLPISDNRGIIEVTRDWLNQEIEKVRNHFIMDYSSLLKDCEPKFEFHVYSVEEMKGSIEAKKFYKNTMDISQEFIDQLSLVDNDKYQPITKMVELYGEKILAVEIKIHKIK